ncbi:MAG TPA: MarR family transcriptional regulator [Alphaproteobacteria bacterium]|nr:MarR family transcriptional regulator [Alphaproteobacteria bacterium]
MRLTFNRGVSYLADMALQQWRGETGYLLNKAARRWNAMFLALLREAGVDDIRPSFGAVLVPLFEEDGLRLGELAQRAGLTKQTLTALIRRIEAQGYVERRPDPKDGRAARLFLTPKARSLEPILVRVIANLEAITRALDQGGDFGPIADWLRAMSDRGAASK